MTVDAKKILDEALQLAPADREALASLLFDSLDPMDPDANAGWQAELDGRISELDEGIVKPIPWLHAKAMIFGKTDETARD